MSQPWQQQQHDLQGGRPHLAGTDDLNPQHPYHPGQVGPSGQPEWPTWAPRVQYGAGRGAGVSQRGRYGAQKWRGGGSYGHAESDPSSWQSGQAGVSAPGRQVHSGSPHLGQHGPQPPPPAEQSMESDAARPVSAGGGVGPAGGASGGPQGRGQGRMSGGQGQGGGRGRGDGSALGTMQAGEQRVVYGPTGEVLPRRVVANRQSAQRSRLRKLQYIADLEATCEELRADIDGMEPQLDFLATRCTGVAQENNMLAAHLGDLNHEVRCKDALNQGLYDEIRRLRGVALTGAYSAPVGMQQGLPNPLDQLNAAFLNQQQQLQRPPPPPDPLRQPDGSRFSASQQSAFAQHQLGWPGQGGGHGGAAQLAGQNMPHQSPQLYPSVFAQYMNPAMPLQLQQQADLSNVAWGGLGQHSAAQDAHFGMLPGFAGAPGAQQQGGFLQASSQRAPHGLGLPPGPAAARPSANYPQYLQPPQGAGPRVFSSSSLSSLPGQEAAREISFGAGVSVSQLGAPTSGQQRQEGPLGLRERQQAGAEAQLLQSRQSHGLQAVAEGRFLQPQPPREPQASQPTVKEEQEVTAHSFSREPPQLSSGGLQAAGQPERVVPSRPGHLEIDEASNAQQLLPRQRTSDQPGMGDLGQQTSQDWAALQVAFSGGHPLDAHQQAGLMGSMQQGSAAWEAQQLSVSGERQAGGRQLSSPQSRGTQHLLDWRASAARAFPPPPSARPWVSSLPGQQAQHAQQPAPPSPRAPSSTNLLPSWQAQQAYQAQQLRQAQQAQQDWLSRNPQQAQHADQAQQAGTASLPAGGGDGLSGGVGDWRQMPQGQLGASLGQHPSQPRPQTSTFALADSPGSEHAQSQVQELQDPERWPLSGQPGLLPGAGQLQARPPPPQAPPTAERAGSLDGLSLQFISLNASSPDRRAEQGTAQASQQAGGPQAALQPEGQGVRQPGQQLADLPPHQYQMESQQDWRQPLPSQQQAEPTAHPQQGEGAARPQLRRPGEPATQLAAVRAAEPAAQQGQHGQQDDRWQQADQVVPELPASPPTSISNATDPGRLGSPGH